MNKTLQKNILLIIIPIILIIGLGIGLVNIGVITTEQEKIITDSVNSTLIIDYGNGIIDTYAIQVENATVYTVLMNAAEENNFTVRAEFDDSYQSHYIYEINNYAEGTDNNFWQYYLNGKYGILGSDLQVVKNNDEIIWKFEPAQI